MARSQPDGRDPNQTWEIPTSKSDTSGSDGRDPNRGRCPTPHAASFTPHATSARAGMLRFTPHTTRARSGMSRYTTHPTPSGRQVCHVSCHKPPGPGQVCHVIGILTMVFLMVSVSRREYIQILPCRFRHICCTYVYRLLPLPPSLHLGSVDFFGFV